MQVAPEAFDPDRIRNLINGEWVRAGIPGEHRTPVDGTEIDLTAKEFDLLAYFLRHPDQALSRQQILSAVWGYDFDPGTNVVEVRAPGHLSHEGAPVLRWALYEAGQQATRQTSPDHAYFLQVRERDGRWRTINDDVGIPVGRPQTLVLA